MNELEFRNRLLQDPNTLDERMLAFLKGNPEHQKALRKARERDSKISGVLNVQAPEGLVERILLKQSYQEKAERRMDSQQVEMITDVTGLQSEHSARSEIGAPKKAHQGWQSWPYAFSGMAASLLVAVLFFGFWQPAQHSHQALTGKDMVVHILEHVEHDPELMKPQALALSENDLNQLFAKVGATLHQPIDNMSYAGECDVEGQRGLHIVMQDESGPVTIIVMPGPQLDAMVAFNESGYTGELIPVKGGLVAILGHSQEQLALVQTRFFKAVNFG